MDLLIDTHALIWSLRGDRKLSSSARRAMDDQENELFVSAVIAWELADLRGRGRLPEAVTIDQVRERLGPTLLDLPADIWTAAERLPNIHGDPVDRMLVAHALAAGMTLVTADADIHRYPVPTLW